MKVTIKRVPKKQTGGSVVDATRTVSPAGVPLDPIHLAATQGLTALPISPEGLPMVNLPPVEVSVPINTTKYGMRAENPRYPKVRQIEQEQGEQAARNWLYAQQLGDLSTGIGKVFSDAVLTAGTLDFPIGKLFQRGKALEGAGSKAIFSVENPVLTQQARLLHPETQAKFLEEYARQAAETEAAKEITTTGINLGSRAKKASTELNPSNYEQIVKQVHGPSEFVPSSTYGLRPENLGVSRGFGSPGTVFTDAPINKAAQQVIEAHEKTHGVFRSYSKEMLQDLQNSINTPKLGGYSSRNTPDEILARMAQFKNALGQDAAQTFTKADMDIIRQHYAREVVDNNITDMLKAIPKGSKQESQFIKNMNKYAFSAAGIGAAGALQEKKQGGALEVNNTGMNVKIKGLPKKQTGGRIASSDEDKALGYFKYPDASHIEFPGSGTRTFVPGPFPIAITDTNGTQILTDKPIRTKGKVTERRLYKHGGEVRSHAQAADPDEATIEAEKDEYIFGTGVPGNSQAGSNIGVGLYKIGGKKHYNGGTKLAANPGDFIFSDDKSLAFTKEEAKDFIGKDINKTKDRTPAALVDRFKNFNEFVSTAQDDKASPVDRKTALFNIENVYDKLADIAVGQEILKGLPNGIPDFAKASIEKRNQPSAQTTGDETLTTGEAQQSASIPQAKYGGTMKFQQGGVFSPSERSRVGLPMRYDLPVFNPYGYNPPVPYSLDFTGQLPEQSSISTSEAPYNYFDTPTSDGFYGKAQLLGSPFVKAPDQNDPFHYDYVFPYGSPARRFFVGDKPIDTAPMFYNRYKSIDEDSTDTYSPTVGGPMDRNVWSPTRQDYALPQDFGSTQRVGTGMPAGPYRLPNNASAQQNDVPYAWSSVNEPIRSNRAPSDLNVDINANIPSNINPGLARPISQPAKNIETRNYNSQVNMTPGEIFGLFSANKRYPTRYPTAQRYYEGDNIDAILTASYKPLSDAPYLANIQRQLNTFNANNSGYGPQSYARNSYAFTQALNAQNQAIGSVAGQNIARQDSLANALAQNAANKGQMRLNLQDKYLRELETAKNNQEIAAKNRMAQTSNLLNAYQRRAAEQRASNAMLDNFQIGPDGNLIATPPKSLKNAVINSTTGNQMSSQLNYLEQIFRLMKQYGVKSSSFVDDALKPITRGQ